MLYSHDSYGLGHLRRTLLIAGRLARMPELSDVLVVTGSPRAQAFEVPEGVDTVKLPAVTKDDGGSYRTRSLRMSLGDTVSLRAALLEATARAFDPDLVLVDHTPLGLSGELVPALDVVRGRARVLLGMREIVDDIARAAVEWQDPGVLDFVRDRYNGVLVYGDPSVTTTAQELGLEQRMPGRVHHVGYVARPMPPRPAPGHEAELPLVLVTVGGGGDGQRVLRAFIALLRTLGSQAPFRSVLLTGPFLSTARRVEITDAARSTGAPVEVVAFTDAPEQLMAAASAVVSMGGYNTVCELMALGVPMLVVPREGPRLEQITRATRLHGRGGIECARIDTLGPGRLAEFVTRALADGPRPAGLDLGGLDGIADAVSRYLLDRRPVRLVQAP